MKLTKIVATISGSGIVCGDGAAGIVRKHLRESDLIAIVGKHSPSVARANVFCLARLKELP